MTHTKPPAIVTAALMIVSVAGLLTVCMGLMGALISLPLAGLSLLIFTATMCFSISALITD